METSDPMGVFHFVTGRSGTACDLDDLIPKKNMDGATVGQENLVLKKGWFYYEWKEVKCFFPFLV